MLTPSVLDRQRLANQDVGDGCPSKQPDVASSVAAGEPQFEATAPVKLPTWQCPAAGSRTAVRAEVTQGWYFTGDSTEASAPASKSPTYATHAKPQSNAKMQ